MTVDNEKQYKNMKTHINEVLDDYYEFLEITSEFKENEYLRDFHNRVVVSVCKSQLTIKESLYVLTIRQMVETIKTLTKKVDRDIMYKNMHYYKELYEKTAKKLEESEKVLDDISKVINRGGNYE